MKTGDLVINIDYPHEYPCGLVLKADVNMWGEEVIPSGVEVMWASGEIETAYEDELRKIDRELTDEELSGVMGGMSPGEFERWRISLINLIVNKQKKEN